jgi:hypothetical protein
MKNEMEEEAVVVYVEVGLYTSTGAAELRKSVKMFTQYIWPSGLRFY